MVEATQEKQLAENGNGAAVRHRSKVFEVKWRNPERSLLDYVSAVWARKYTVLLVTVVFGVVGMIYALAKPNTYASRARLMVHGTEMGGSAADAAANMLGAGRILPDQVVTAVEIIRSRVVLETVVDQLGYEEILAPYKPGAGYKDDERGLMDRVVGVVHYIQAKFLIGDGVDFSKFSEEELRDDAIETIEENLIVTPATRGTTMELSYLHTNPDSAHTILAAVVKAAINRYGEVVAPPAGKDWLDTKVTQSQSDLDRARRDLQEFAGTNGTTDFTEEIKAMSKELGIVAGRLRNAQITLSENDKVIESLRKEKSTLDATIERETQRVYGPNAAAANLVQQITLLKTQRALDPDSTNSKGRLTRQITSLETQLESLEADVKPARTIAVQPNPKYVLLETEIRQREVGILGAQQQVPIYQEELKRLQKTLEGYREQQRKVAGMHQRLKDAEAEHKQLREMSKSYEITNELDTRGLTNLRRVEPAVYPRQKEGPQRGKLIRVRLSRRLVRHTDVAFALGRSDVVSMPVMTARNLQRFDEARRRGWE